jgi:tetratricopeptide (TPR) repeat protein
MIGPTVRIIHRNLESTLATNTSLNAFEVNNVDSIDKVYRILTKLMNLSEDDVKPAARECLKWIYRGNALMERNIDEQLSDVIYAYTAALNTDHKPQKGIILLLRATAYLKRAFYHQKILKASVNDLALSVPDPTKLSRILNMVTEYPSFGPFMFQQIVNDCRLQEKKFRQTKFRHGLYEYALLHAAQDALRATQILPSEAQAWLRAADALAELRKLKESIQYYEKAIALDKNLEGSLRPVIYRLCDNQEFLEKARALGWSDDTLRLALDVS